MFLLKLCDIFVLIKSSEEKRLFDESIETNDGDSNHAHARIKMSGSN